MFNKVSIDEAIENSGFIEGIDIELYKKYEQSDNDFYSCFFLKFDSQDKLSNLWLEIVSHIGTEYISQLDSDFSIWNVYIVFTTNDTIDKNTKYMIENNKLFLRKIVLDYGFKYTEDDVIEFLNNKILGADIKATKHKEINVELNYSEVTVDLLESISDISNTESSRVQRNEWIESLLRI